MTVSITVTEVNDTPVAVGDSISVDEDDSRTFDVRTNDNAGPNESGQTLTATIFTNPTHGDVVDNLDGTFTYTPDAGYNGLDGFIYRLCDDGTTNGAADVKCTTVGATVDVQVDSVNDAPSGGTRPSRSSRTGATRSPRPTSASATRMATPSSASASRASRLAARSS